MKPVVITILWGVGRGPGICCTCLGPLPHAAIACDGCGATRLRSVAYADDEAGMRQDGIYCSEECHERRVRLPAAPAGVPM